MARRLTYIDACVFLHAWNSKSDLSAQAVALLRDRGRALATSTLLPLELYPKTFHAGGSEAERLFYESFLGAAVEKVEVDAGLIEEALQLGIDHGISGADAIHAAAAIKSGAEEFITSEKPAVGTKPGSAFYRVAGLNATHTGNAEVIG